MNQDWRERAACIGANPKLFQILDRDDPTAKGLDDDQRRDLMLKNFEEAKTYCIRCPVSAHCKADGRRKVQYDGYVYRDADVTIRGGENPGLFTGRVRGRPRKATSSTMGPPIPDDAPELCKAGHKAEWGMYAKDKLANGQSRWRMECKECRRVKNSSWRKYQKAELGKSDVILARDRQHANRRPDHEPVWLLRSGAIRCHVCYLEQKRASSQAYRDRKRESR